MLCSSVLRRAAYARTLGQTKRFFFSSGNLLSSIPPIPDNAPTLDENTEWLKTLSRHKTLESDSSPEEEVTYRVTEKSDLEDPEKNEQFVKFKSKKTKRTHTVVTQASEENKYHTVSVLASDFFISSSPFSSMNSRRRPKAESVQPFFRFEGSQIKIWERRRW